MEAIVLPELKELEFDEVAHRYILDGVDIPSVSKLMEPLSKHEYRGIDEWTLNRAADRGTSVHNTLENYVKYGVEDVKPEFQGYMNGFLEWWNTVNPIPVAAEFKVYHKLLKYGGTIDLLAYIDGELNMIDYKTTSKLIQKNCRVQTEGYSQALKSHGIVIQRKRILHLQKGGRWKCPELDAYDAEAWRVFGSLKCVYDYLESK